MAFKGVGMRIFCICFVKKVGDVFVVGMNIIL